MELTPFAYTLANTNQKAQRVKFELQFNLLQNSLINRFNSRVEAISATPRSVERKIDDLTERSQKLVDSLPALEHFRQGNQNTLGALEAIFDDITELFGTFNSDATVDADEVAAFEAKRDLVATKIENLFVFVHPDINDANVIPNLKADVKTIRGLDVVVGDLTTDNIDVSNSLTALQSEVSVAMTVVQNTISTTLYLERRIRAKFASVDASLFELTADEKHRREVEIANAEANLGNLLRVISLSFESSASMGEMLNNRLKPVVPPPGSALNIFS